MKQCLQGVDFYFEGIRIFVGGYSVNEGRMGAYGGKVVSVLNCKGGVGRTMVVLNLAHALALRGYKVLVIDNTIGGDLTDCLCHESRLGASLYDVFASGGESYDVRSAICCTRYDKIDIMPCVNSSHIVNQSFLSKLNVGMRKISESIVDVVSSEYDFTVIDSPPGGDVWLGWTLLVADLVIVPTICFNNFAQSGIKTLMDVYSRFKRHQGVGCDKFFVLLNKFDIREGIDCEPYDIANSFDCMSVFRHVIPVCKKYRRLVNCGSVLKSCPYSNCAIAFRAFAKEFLDVVNGCSGV